MSAEYISRKVLDRYMDRMQRKLDRVYAHQQKMYKRIEALELGFTARSAEE